MKDSSSYHGIKFLEFRRLCVVVSWQGREISIRKGPVLVLSCELLSTY